jgi:hypothetical protein
MRPLLCAVIILLAAPAMAQEHRRGQGQEAALDGHFKDHTITPENLVTLTARIGETHGLLRAVHLKYHLAMAELLTAEQSRRYAELRGYR